MKIKVNREQINGRLDFAILEELEQQELITPVKNWSVKEEYEVNFYNKNNRKNGKLFCIVTPKYDKEVVKGYYVKDIYRFNTLQQCTLTSIPEKELHILLEGINY